MSADTKRLKFTVALVYDEPASQRGLQSTGLTSEQSDLQSIVENAVKTSHYYTFTPLDFWSFSHAGNIASFEHSFEKLQEIVTVKTSNCRQSQVDGVHNVGQQLPETDSEGNVLAEL